jgi:hypothetical protein
MEGSLFDKGIPISRLALQDSTANAFHGERLTSGMLRKESTLKRLAQSGPNADGGSAARAGNFYN